MDANTWREMSLFAGLLINGALSLRNGRKVAELKVNVNGKVERLIAATESLARAEGYREGSEAERRRPPALEQIPALVDAGVERLTK